VLAVFVPYITVQTVHTALNLVLFEAMFLLAFSSHLV
jgi:hypothetical protein